MDRATFPATIPALLAWRVAREPERPWLFFEDRVWTLSEVAREVARHAVGLAAQGVVRGDRVAMVLANTPDTLFTWLGANQLGAVAVMLNPAHKPAELTALFRLVTPRVVVASEHGPLVAASLGALETSLRAPIVAPSALPTDGPLSDVDVSADDACVLIATSGTTGAPKAVVQTHRAYTLTAEAFASWLDLTNDDRLLAVLPLFHINAQAYSTMGALASGELALARRFSASRFWEEAAALGATQCNGVGAMMHILLRTAPRPADRAHRIRVFYGALALPEETHRAFEARFGLRLTVGYGMSETTFGTVWPHDQAPRFGTIGRLRQHPRLGEINRARIVKDDGSDAAVGETGELWLASPAVTPGYFQNPEETAKALEGGWLHTGDLVRCEADGFFTFVSRKKHVIRRRGENVAAAEVEGVIAAFPGVRDVAVVGVPSELGEEELVAYVAPDSGVDIDVAALRAFVATQLADFKVPSEFRVRDALPRTATERIAKHELA